MVPINVDNSTVAITSIITSGIVFVFAVVHDVSPSISVGVAAFVGILLYAIGVIPIGLLVVVGIGLVIGIVKTLAGRKK